MWRGSWRQNRTPLRTETKTGTLQEDTSTMATTPTDWQPDTRYSLRQLERWANDGHRKPLEDLLRAWKGIQELPPDDPNSFWVIAGYHGIPLAPFDPSHPHLAPPFSWWGGYCHHGNVLFPMWHRAYMQHFEAALRTQVADVSMAYWDTGSDESRKSGLPKTLTDETIEIDGEVFPNPLLCSTYPVDIEPSAQYQNPRKPPVADFSKRAGTHTVRYPMTGFYASKVETVAAAGEAHNEAMRQLYPRYEDRLQALNLNVMLALVGDSQDESTETCDGTADGETYARMRRCLDAPTFNIFSNNNSTGKWYTSLEQPHDEVHLAIGGQDHKPIRGFSVPSKSRDKNGFLSKSTSDAAEQIIASSGDMGENETAAFDPIFFFHHCNIDRILWIWQKKWGKTEEGSIEIDPTDMEGTYGQSSKGQGGTRATPGTEKLTMDTPLHPFKSPSGDVYTSRDLVDLKKQLGVQYSLGSFDKEEWSKEVKETPGPEIMLSVANINKANFLGSFRVTVSHQDPVSQKLSAVASVSVLSRWNLKRCKNCQVHISRDVHVDLTSVKRRFAPQDISEHSFVIEFVDRSSTEDVPIVASGRYSEGKWTPILGKDKIELIRIELDQRQ